MNRNREWDIFDLLNILSFAVGLMNLDLNITQEDMDSRTQAINKEVDERTKIALAEIHDHLKKQDAKLDTIIKRLEEIENGKG